MILGFAGTQHGMSLGQQAAFKTFVAKESPTELHHGDCIGSDAEAHNIFALMCPTHLIVIHPPSNPRRRAFKSSGRFLILPPKPYRDRNQDIVVACDVLFVTPKENHEVLRSGTWMIYRMMRKLRGLCIAVNRDGVYI